MMMDLDACFLPLVESHLFDSIECFGLYETPTLVQPPKDARIPFCLSSGLADSQCDDGCCLASNQNQSDLIWKKRTCCYFRENPEKAMYYYTTKSLTPIVSEIRVNYWRNYDRKTLLRTRAEFPKTTSIC